MPLWKYHFDRIQKTWTFYFPNKIMPNSTMLQQLIYNQIVNHLLPQKVKLIFTEEKIDVEITEFKIESRKINKPIKLIYYKNEKISSYKTNFKTLERTIYNNSIDYAHKNSADQSIILDNNDNIIETSIANILFIKDNEIHTPSLKSGCINGVYRSYLKERIRLSKKWKWIEKTIHINNANEYNNILIINALRGMQIAKII